MLPDVRPLLTITAQLSAIIAMTKPNLLVVAVKIKMQQVNLAWGLSPTAAWNKLTWLVTIIKIPTLKIVRNTQINGLLLSATTITVWTGIPNAATMLVSMLTARAKTSATMIQTAAAAAAHHHHQRQTLTPA